MAGNHLKAVGAAIRNSPKVIRKKLGGVGAEPSHHEILDEDWYHSEDPVKSGITFYCKYLGSMGVHKTHGPGSTEDAVKSIVQEAKLRTSKLQKVKLTVSSKFLRLEDVTKQVKLDEIPLYRVSYCTVDPYYDKVFCYIARNGETKKLECHAYLCGKKSKAEAITLSVAQAFNIAYENWKDHKQKADQRKTNNVSSDEAKASTSPVKTATQPATNNTDDLLGEPLLQPVPIVQPKAPTPPPQIIPEMKFELLPISPVHHGSNPFRTSDTASPLPPRRMPTSSHSDSTLGILQTTLPKARSLNYIAVEDEFDLEFQKLAEARSNPHLLDIGELDRSQVSGDVKQYMLLGDRSYDDLSRSKSHDDLMLT